MIYDIYVLLRFKYQNWIENKDSIHNFKFAFKNHSENKFHNNFNIQDYVQSYVLIQWMHNNVDFYKSLYIYEYYYNIYINTMIMLLLN